MEIEKEQDIVSRFNLTKQWLTENSELIGAVSDILIPLIAITFTLLAFLWNRRKDRLDFVEQSFNDLQSINSLVLSDQNMMRAAVDSIWPNEEFDEHEVRKVYLNYFRINRFYRTWNYAKQGVISRKQAMKIIAAHAAVLKPYERHMDVVLKLGYPADFQKDLTDVLRQVSPIPRLFSNIKCGDDKHNKGM